MVEQEPTKSLGRRDAELFVLSALILYLEVALIRWIGTEVRIFAYLGNLVLVVCFFGVGLGCCQATRPASLTRLGLNLLIVAGLISNPLRWRGLDLRAATVLLSNFEDSPVWGGSGGVSGGQMLAGLAIVGCLTYLVLMIFVPPGQLLGRAFQEHPRLIRAYSVNVAGSLAGVWLYNAVSWASLPPVAWFAVATVLLAVLVPVAAVRGWGAVALVGAATVAVALGQEPGVRTIWTPYQKLRLSPFYADAPTNHVLQGYLVTVNGAYYQHMVDLSEGFVAAHPELFDRQTVQLSHYNLPFQFKRDLHRLLIVGAGTGNNAAAALRAGVPEVDCVDIDPQIYALGKELHPEQPYASPRVHMVVNDARAFFKQARSPYDAIWLGLLDSHTLGSAYNNLRLDHYVYTLESFRECRRLLADDGVLIVTFCAERDWIADRLYGVLRAVFGHAPLAYQDPNLPARYGLGGWITLVTARSPVTLQALPEAWLRDSLRPRLREFAGQTRLTTDDWPYLYLEHAKVPKLHWVTSLAILGTVALARRRVFGAQGGLNWHFFALGAAFLLLEVQTVSRATLLFGMTWAVNAIVISAVLIMILAANAVAARWPGCPRWFVIAGLAVTIAGLVLVPLDWFNALSGAAKLAVTSAFLTAPVFFAGLIFIRSFARCADKPFALGSNLIGALAGGLLESVSFLTGMRALGLLVGLLYVVALCVPVREDGR